MKANNKSTTRNKSVIDRLTYQNKINNSLLVLIGNLTLEDLIAIKLELTCSHLNHRLYGFDLWNKIKNITDEAVLKFAISSTSSKNDAARFLGINYLQLYNLLKKYDINSFFEYRDN